MEKKRRTEGNETEMNSEKMLSGLSSDIAYPSFRASLRLNPHETITAAPAKNNSHYVGAGRMIHSGGGEAIGKRWCGSVGSTQRRNE